VTISSDEFGALFSAFEREAFRLETLSSYAVGAEAETFRAFMAGEPRPEVFMQSPWVSTVRGNTEAGRRMYRVHVLARPLTDYLRFELGWGYQRNQAAGEEFFILDTTERPNPLAGVPDFWAFDETSVVSMVYDADGGYLGAEREPDSEKWMQWRDVAMSHAEPFTEWWERYGIA